MTTVARENSKGKDGPVTGFNLNGYDDGPPTVVTDGPPVGSCPDSHSTFQYDNNAVTTPGEGGGFEVTINGTDWFPIG